MCGVMNRIGHCGAPERKTLFLTGDGSANTARGDGRIVGKQPPTSATDQFVYDPTNPVPSLHGSGLQACAADQRPLAQRRRHSRLSN